jgi:hypothetical protein
MNWISLVSDDGGKSASIGRITSIVLLLLMSYFWIGKSVYLGFESVTLEEIKVANELFKMPDGLLQSFMTTIGYNGFKKLNITKRS